MLTAAVATEPGSRTKSNEDWVGVAPTTLVLLDGLSSATDADAACRHGTPWFVQRLGLELLVAASVGDVPLADALAAAIVRVADMHAGCKPQHPNSPSATVAILRLAASGDLVEYLVLGDCRIVLNMSTGPRVVTDERVDDFARDERELVLRESIGTERHAEAVNLLIATQKPMRNHPDGYWVAGGDPAAAAHALTDAVPRADLDAAVLLSDGASRIVDTFELLTWRNALSVLASEGPAALIGKVRAAESTDPDGRRWPRYKSSDDATAAYVQW